MHDRENFWEPIRSWLWPKLHGIASALGAFTVGTTGDAQYVGTVPYAEEEFEEILSHEMNFGWNPIAALKSNSSGDVSVGSWTHRDSGDSVYWDGEARPRWPDFLTDYQLHVTIFEAESGGTDVFAHFERSYWRHPLAHLAGRDFSADDGVLLTRIYLIEHDIKFTDNPPSTGS